MTTYLNLNTLTNNAKVTQINLDYYAPVATVQGANFTSTYAFLGKEDPWPYASDGVTEIPTQPTNDQKYLRSVFKNMFALKQLTTGNISPVIQRINWANNTNYFAYSDDVDLFAKDANGFLINNFYVKNRYDQVFKCLANNNGGISTEEPYFQPGSYGTNNIYQGTDYYKWKYMYSIDAGSKKRFMDSNWMPVPVSTKTPQPYLTTAGYGDVEVINITNGGSGYDATNSFITVTITGDGTGLVANITPSQIVNGVIKDVVVKSGYAGKNYTYANVEIKATVSSSIGTISPYGSGATAIAPVSPVGGHAYDPISELGCSNIMYEVEFNGTENGIIPTDGVVYRQIGLLVQPQMYGASGGAVLANGSIYNTSTQLTLSSGAGNVYIPDEIVYQNDGKNNRVFSGTVLNFNTSTNVLQLINTTGTVLVGQLITGSTSLASRAVFTNTQSNIIPYSGYITYIENRAGVQRSSDGIEQLRFVLGY